MTNDAGRREPAQKEREIKEALGKVLSNPELAAEAFPNPAIRANVLPLLEHFELLTACKKTL